MSFTKEQPKDGDIVLNCGHQEGKKFHWYKTPSGVKIITPFSVEVGYWIVACEECHKKCKGDGSKIIIANHGYWQGDEPHIKERDHNV